MKLPVGEKTPSVWFMGIEWGIFPIKAKVLDKTDQPIPEGWYTRSNSGISGVIPAWRVMKLLNAEEFAMGRE